MDLGIRGRKAIICASSRGLGKACALSLSKEGVIVYLNGRHQDDLDIAAQEIQEMTKTEVHTVLADITTPGVGFEWGTTSGTTPMVVGAGGFVAYLADGATALSSFYVTNPSANALVLQIGVMSN